MFYNFNTSFNNLPKITVNGTDQGLSVLTMWRETGENPHVQPGVMNQLTTKINVSYWNQAALMSGQSLDHCAIWAAQTKIGFKLLTSGCENLYTSGPTSHNWNQQQFLAKFLKKIQLIDCWKLAGGRLKQLR